MWCGCLNKVNHPPHRRTDIHLHVKMGRSLRSVRFGMNVLGIDFTSRPTRRKTKWGAEHTAVWSRLRKSENGLDGTIRTCYFIADSSGAVQLSFLPVDLAMKKQSHVQKSAELGKSQLKKKVAQIVLAQGNIFIKDLLRSNNVPIGNTKADFSRNLNAAIDAGALTQAVIEAWLGEIEGWGNQHVYLFEPFSIFKTKIVLHSRHRNMLDCWTVKPVMIFRRR